MILAYPAYRCLTNEEPARMKEDRSVYQCCDSNLNFSTATCSEDDCEYGPYKKSSKVARQDPMSHRIIEKRRRDRMNNCLADLSRLIPTDYLKKGRGRIEKTEIIEMAIKHMKHLQTQERGSPIEQYRLGYQECLSEAMRFMVEIEGHFLREPICVRLLNHLQKHGEQLSKGPATVPTSPILEQVPSSFPVAQVPTLLKNDISETNHISPSIQRSDKTSNGFTVPKAEPENSNSNDAHPNAFVICSNNLNINNINNKSEEFEKDSNVNGMSYKYKTNIKLRFSQDLNAHEVPKKRKMNEPRRNSITIYENQSSNQSSPPCSEPSTRLSEMEHRQTPPFLINSQPQDAIQRFTPAILNHPDSNNNNNFNVPVFVLHTKGAYYIPLTIDYKTLLPFLQNYNITDQPSQLHNVVLHPVTINVNFMPNFNVDLLKNANNKYKYEFNNNNNTNNNNINNWH